MSGKGVVRSVLTVLTGSVGAQVIAFALLPVITRLYSPEVYGVYGVFVSFFNVVIPFAALSYPMAIVIAKSETEVGAIATGAFLVSLTSASVFLVVWLLVPTELALKVVPEVIMEYAYVVPLGIIFVALQQVGLQCAIRDERFFDIAKTTVRNSTIFNIGKALSGLISVSAAPLIIITLLSYFFHSLSLGAMRNIFRKKSCNLKNIYWTLLKYADFALLRTPQIALYSVGLFLPMFFISEFYGAEYAGYYALARLALGAPADLVGHSVSGVFYPKINNLIRGEGESVEAFRLILKSSVMLFALFLIPYASMSFVGESVFVLVFGDGWAESGVYAGYIAPWMLAVICCKPALASIPVLRKQGVLLIHDVIWLLIKVIALAIVVKKEGDVTLSLLVYSFISAASYFFILVWVLLLTKAEGSGEPRI